MYRLTAANGSFTDNNNTDFPFTLEMSYTASGNIATKNVTADILSADNTVSQTAYEGNYTYNTGQSHTIAAITGTGIDQAFSWDLNGNLSTHTDNIKSLNRYLCWDEENRLMAVKDQNYLSAYVYDAAGERVWKLSGEVTQMKINGVGTIDVASLSNKTLYVSPYVVYNQQGYSKHYYAGAERVSSRIGGGTMYGLQHPINDTVTPITDEYPELATHLWDMLERSFSECLDLITEYITYDPYMVSIQESASQNYAENNWYIYHSDHLGSSSFLTDASGDPTQHLQYLPFGENYIEQRASTDYYSPYTFSAKERDMETGYSYFGARYYDPNVSAWLSVDPLSDKYPSMSAYMYCAGNPVMLVDPDGRSANPILDENGNLLGTDSKGWEGTPLVMKTGDYKDNMDHTEAKQKGTYLDHYGKGINISKKTWDKIEKNGGKKMTPYVENNSSKTVYYKPEGDNGNYKNEGAYPIAPNTDLYAQVDGVATHKYSDAIYKVCTGTHIRINEDGSVKQIGWSLKKGGYTATMPALDGWIKYKGNYYRNGKPFIKDDSLDDGTWESLYRKAKITGGNK